MFSAFSKVFCGSPKKILIHLIKEIIIHMRDETLIRQ